MSWRPAGCITQMLKEANTIAPNRDKSSDGIIGDQAHQASGGDHNPDSRGIVHAIDLTQDPAGGWDCDLRVSQIVANKDWRVKYIIWNRHMWRSYDKPGIPAWTKASYSGSSPHTDHMHVSVNQIGEDDSTEWWEDEDMTPQEHNWLKDLRSEIKIVRDNFHNVGVLLNQIKAELDQVKAKTDHIQ